MHTRYLSLSQAYADRIRKTMMDDHGHQVETSTAGPTGFGPCRCCLKQFNPGEKRLLLSYAPVGADHAYNEIGPIFIHEDCIEYQQTELFPPEVKNGRLPIRLVLRCYNKEKRLVTSRFVKDNNEVENAITSLLADPSIEFIHIRNATDQCYIAEARKNQGTGS
jgi:hypothetical protein